MPHKTYSCFRPAKDMQMSTHSSWYIYPSRKHKDVPLFLAVIEPRVSYLPCCLVGTYKTNLEMTRVVVRLALFRPIFFVETA